MNTRLFIALGAALWISSAACCGQEGDLVKKTAEAKLVDKDGKDLPPDTKVNFGNEKLDLQAFLKKYSAEVKKSAASSSSVIRIVDAKGEELPPDGVKIVFPDGRKVPLQEVSAPKPSGDYDVFVGVLAALAKLVVLAMLLERGLAFIFEFPLVRWGLPKAEDVAAKKDAGKPLTRWEQKVLDGNLVPSTVRALISGFVAVATCRLCDFNIFMALFPDQQSLKADKMSLFLTGLVVAGGSSAAIALFQGVLGFSKQARDGMIAARNISSERETEKARTALLEEKTKQAEEKKKMRVAELASLKAAVELEKLQPLGDH